MIFEIAAMSGGPAHLMVEYILAVLRAHAVMAQRLHCDASRVAISAAPAHTYLLKHEHLMVHR